MPKKNANEMDALFKKTFDEVKGARTYGWDAEDTEKVAMPLILALSEKDGKDIKPSKELTTKITAALQLTPKRVVAFIKAELAAAAVVMDAETEERLLWLVDLPKVRTDLTRDGLLQKAGKGKKSKKKITDLLK
jgi:hypothetical protein